MENIRPEGQPSQENEPLYQQVESASQDTIRAKIEAEDKSMLSKAMAELELAYSTEKANLVEQLAAEQLKAMTETEFKQLCSRLGNKLLNLYPAWVEESEKCFQKAAQDRDDYEYSQFWKGESKQAQQDNKWIEEDKADPRFDADKVIAWYSVYESFYSDRGFCLSNFYTSQHLTVGDYSDPVRLSDSCYRFLVSLLDDQGKQDVKLFNKAASMHVALEKTKGQRELIEHMKTEVARELQKQDLDLDHLEIFKKERKSRSGAPK